MTAREEDRGIWLAPDWSGLAIEAEDGSLYELGREHGDGAWVSQGMLDVVPDHWVRLVPSTDSGIKWEWGCGSALDEVFGFDEETARQGAEMTGTLRKRHPAGPWIEVAG